MIVKHLLVPVTLSITVIDDNVRNEDLVSKVQAELERVNNKLLDKDFPTQILNPSSVTANGIYRTGEQS